MGDSLNLPPPPGQGVGQKHLGRARVNYFHGDDVTQKSVLTVKPVIEIPAEIDLSRIA